MTLNILKSKIHRAVVTEANLHYVGSVTLDRALMDAAGLHPYELVHIVDIDNGNRFETYVMEGKRGTGEICINGAAARLALAGDKVILMAYTQIDEKDLADHKPRIVFVNEKNEVTDIKTAETAGEIR